VNVFVVLPRLCRDMIHRIECVPAAFELHHRLEHLAMRD